MKNKNFSKKAKILFSSHFRKNLFSLFCKTGEKAVDKLISDKKAARLSGISNPKEYKRLEKKYSGIPQEGAEPNDLMAEMIKDFMKGVPLWRSPTLQHNVGAAVNKVASSMYGLALDLNIFNINSGLAGNALVAEQIVANMLAQLAGVDPKKGHGIFTFGGTGTNLYALKMGINKSDPAAPTRGVSDKLRFLITEDAHSCHAISANWLGVGTEKLIVVPADKNRTSNLKEAELLARRALEKGRVIGTIMINGGTTYDNAVDNIKGFRNLRDKLVKEYNLDYKPHLHVDSVIGWAWLMFRDYDFLSNPLKIPDRTLKAIKKQYDRISNICLADSWGVDFHKGVGGAPIPCSIFMVNDNKDFAYLSKKGGKLAETHHVAGEFSFESPSDYTLETSRPGGAPLAALAALCSLGQKGFQEYLSSLITSVIHFRDLVKEEEDMILMNLYSLGYVTMVTLLPPEMNQIKTFEYLRDKAGLDEIKDINHYTKSFFNWDKKTRAEKTFKNVYSCSSSYIQTGSGESLSGLKFYPVSPHFSTKEAQKAFTILKRQRKKFDEEVWKKK